MGVANPILRAGLPEVQTPVHLIRNYLNQPDFPAFSIAEINRVAAYEWSESKDRQYFYYVLEGQGEFILNDESFTLMQGDIFVVPQNARYRTPVGVKLLAITTPRFEK